MIRVLRETKKTDPIGSKQILQQAYENTFGIFDYISQTLNEQHSVDPNLKRPLSSVAMHFAEDTMKVSRLREMISLFAELEIGKHYNLNLIEFLDLPHEYVEIVLQDCKKRHENESKRTSQVLEDLKSTQLDNR